MVTTRADFWSGRTARARPFKSPPRELPRTERGGAAARRSCSQRLRTFMITVVVADDLLALVVFALVYSDSIDVMALIRAAGLFALAVRAAARLEHPGSAFASSAKAHAGAPARGRRE